MSIQLKDPDDFAFKLVVAGHSQRSFAAHIGISNPYLNQVAKASRNPSPKVAKKICDGLGVTFEDIFFTSKDNKSYQKSTA